MIAITTEPKILGKSVYVHKLTLWCRGFIELLIKVKWLVKRFPTFMEYDGSLPHLQKPITGSHPDSVESNQYLHDLFL
jgi:hypothetical protein